MTGADRTESGFTLVELLVAMALSTMVFAVVALALITASGNYTASASKLFQSHDAQLLSPSLVPDVQSAGPNATDVDTSPQPKLPFGPAGCDPTGPPGGTNVVKLTWSDFDTGTTYAAAYRLEGTELYRYFCVAGNPSAPMVVGRNIQAATATYVNGEVVVKVTVLGDKDLAQLGGRDPQYQFEISASPRTTSVPRATTTLPPACSIADASATPSSVQLVGGGQLSVDVSIRVTTTGTCAGLTLALTPGADGSPQMTLALAQSGSAAWTTTITGNRYSTWTLGSHPLSVYGPGGPLGGVANPIQFTVTP